MQTPVIVGVAQITARWNDSGERRDPLSLMFDAARAAIDDAGARSLVQAIDALWVVNTLSWSYADAPGALAARLGLSACDRLYSSIGGNTPQALVQRAARELEAGTRRAVVLVGGEAGCSAQRAGRHGRDLGWPPLAQPEQIDGDARIGASAAEFAYELMLPALMYPLIETALRARCGRSPAEHAAHLGRVCERLSQVAATNPLAWFRDVRSATQIATPSAENRYVGYPYTKLMNAVFAVDQSAAVVMTTEAEATRLGIPRERWVYPMGSAALNDVWIVTERPRLDDSPAIRAAAQAALRQAGLTIADIDALDLYSCFPCAVELACDALGISGEDPRGLTVTGGLAYFGGPGNNYVMHSIATVVERIRQRTHERALVTALGWYATKHVVGIYGTEPAALPWNGRDLGAEQAAIDRTALPPPLAVHDGTLTVEAFVIQHGRDGASRNGVVVGRARGGERALAAMDLSASDLAALEATEVVGTAWSCRHDAHTGRNLARPAR